MSIIDVLDVLNACSEYLYDPEKEESVENFQKIKQDLEIKPYLSLKQKEEIIEKTLLDIKARDGKIFTYTSCVELSLTFNALLAYTNIDSDIIDAVKDYDFYDILWASGICDYILQYCADDYKRVSDMVYHMLSFENLSVLIDELKGMDPNSINELTQEFKKFRLETKPESLIALGNIAASSDPILHSIKHNIEDSALNTVKETESEENGV